MPPKKRSLTEITDLREPRLSGEQRKHFEEGIRLFNSGKYWEAHEAWEDVWKAMTDRPEDDGEIILRGLIQLTAGLHGLSQGKRGGGRSNLQKAREKLSLFPRRFLGVDLDRIVFSIQNHQGTPGELLGFRIRWKSKK